MPPCRPRATASPAATSEAQRTEGKPGPRKCDLPMWEPVPSQELSDRRRGLPDNQETRMRLVNLTPHAIVLQSSDGARTTVQPSGTVARRASTPGELENIDGVPVPIAARQSFGQVEGIPAFEPDTLYIVSGMITSSMPEGLPLVAPGTGPNDGAIRFPATLPDGSKHPQAGQIEAVTRLVRG